MLCLIQMRFIAFDISTHNFLVLVCQLCQPLVFSYLGDGSAIPMPWAKPTTLSSVAAQP